MSLIQAENGHICWLVERGDAIIWRCENCGIQVTAPDRKTAESEAELHRDVKDTEERIDTDEFYQLMADYRRNQAGNGWECDCDNCIQAKSHPDYLSGKTSDNYDVTECEWWCDEVDEAFEDDFWSNMDAPHVTENTSEYEKQFTEDSIKNHEDGFVAEDCGAEWGLKGLVKKT